jgi:5-methyltetrahydrofolate--homocysteine methyltransferase
MSDDLSKRLIDAMVDMKEEETMELVKSMADSSANPMQILEYCTQAMEIVGQRFEAGDYYLPELLMAGEMLKQISEIVKPKITETEGSSIAKKGKVLIGTVKGDIHDIGKDIVVFLLDVNGFEVQDLGIDVPPDQFVSAIKSFRPQVVGMSGLLTIAYDAMRETVAAIEAAGLRQDVKIIIGGGQMSDKVKTYAGADAYGKDAVDGIAWVKNWVSGE